MRTSSVGRLLAALCAMALGAGAASCSTEASAVPLDAVAAPTVPPDARPGVDPTATTRPDPAETADTPDTRVAPAGSTHDDTGNGATAAAGAAGAGTTTTTTSTTASTTTTTDESTTDRTTVDGTPLGFPRTFPDLEQALFFLALDNVAASITVRHDGDEVWRGAVGRRADGAPVTSDTPFVVASVSKLVTALSIARLVEQGVVTTETPVPWAALGLAHDPLWDTVTVRELLSHTSGMPVNRRSWLDDPGPCSIPLADAVAAPPTIARTTWQYSNGNYCALGLLVEHLTGSTLDQAAYDLVFRPAGITGPYLSTEGLRSDSAPSPRGVARLARLGGAGTWLASTDDVAAMLAAVTDDDREVLRWPGVLVDQYGWGHTGTVDGAKACAWVLTNGDTTLATVAAVVSGRSPATGGDVCDLVVPALARDLGVWNGEPDRSPV